MADILHAKREILQIIQNKLLPWAQANGGHSFILAQMPLHVPPNVHILSRPAPPSLKSGAGRSYFRLTHWEEANLEASRFPYFACVLEGEADLIVSSPVQSSDAALKKKTDREKQRKESSDKNQQMVLTVPAHTFIIYPPGVPHDAGSQPHWVRPHPEYAHARILWMNIVPAGIICHTCTTIKGQHTTQNNLFLYDPHLLTLAHFLMEELAERHPRYELITQSYLLALLGRLERVLSTGTVLPTNETPRLDSSEGGNKSDIDNVFVLQRACQYIQSHLHEALSPAIIAHHSYISAPHLMRIFRIRQGTTIMKYVGQCRIEYAKSLLRDTDLPISEISRLSGYRRLPRFSHAFSIAAGLSPLEFRKKIRAIED